MRATILVCCGNVSSLKSGCGTSSGDSSGLTHVPVRSVTLHLVGNEALPIRWTIIVSSALLLAVAAELEISQRIELIEGHPRSPCEPGFAPAGRSANPTIRMGLLTGVALTLSQFVMDISGSDSPCSSKHKAGPSLY